MIPLIEELSLNAWPALETLLVGGWVVRFAGGYTRRANSVLPLYAAAELLDAADLLERVEACEALYRRRGLPVIFKLTPESRPAGLDALLEARGYRAEARTGVQTLEPVPAVEAPAGLEVRSEPDADWLDGMARMSALTGERRARHEQILAAIAPERGFANLRGEDGTVLACGLGVVQMGWLGLFDIVVDPAARGRGLGECLVRGLLAWGRGAGARASYLQVMLDNAPALRLYARVGYRPAYEYWYRVKE
jgi:ribosomal protein S18 acetylase RimI-like enzyme